MFDEEGYQAISVIREFMRREPVESRAWFDSMRDRVKARTKELSRDG